MPSLTLESGELSLVLEPAFGGKILSLRSTKSGREWLWRHPTLAPIRPDYGMSYVAELDSGGWDEVFPSVSPETVGGRDIPDHGDAAQLPWSVVSADGREIILSVDTRFAPCRFERSIRVDGDGFVFRYRVTNLGESATPYLWCAHPLFALEPGMVIAVAPGSAWRCAGGVGVPRDTAFAWPHIPGAPAVPPGECFPIPDTRSGAAPFAAKLFSAAGDVSSVSVVTPDGAESIRLRWDAGELPYLALWLNARAWSGAGGEAYFNLGVEPTTAPCDGLNEAIAGGHARVLPPGGVHTWSLRVDRIPFPKNNSLRTHHVVENPVGL